MSRGVFFFLTRSFANAVYSARIFVVAQMSSLLCLKLRMRDRLLSRLSVAPTLNGQPHHAQDSALYSSSETQVKDNGRTCLRWVETSAGAKRLNLRTFKTSACRCKER